MNIKSIIKEEYYNMNNIIVWHGSTKKFNDFDLNMVGTGDNNDLGGWGIYFSDDKAVSQRYYLPSGQIKQYRLKSGEYFDLDNTIDITETARMLIQLKKIITIKPNDLLEFEETYVNEDNYTATNKNVYDWLSYILKSEKNASLFLNKLGYVGNTMIDRWERNSRNYIVFTTDAILGEIEPDEYNDETEPDEY